MLAGPAGAVTVLTFEGLQNFESVENFYNGGLGGLGSGPGPNLGAVFSFNEADGIPLAIIDRDAGGSGDFGGEPSPSTALVFDSGSQPTQRTLNVLAGFSTGFFLFYTARSDSGLIVVYDGLDSTGSIVATLHLPPTPVNGSPDPTGEFSPFIPIGIGFDGVARSISFVGELDFFDDITFGSLTPGAPTPVPEPGTLLLFGTAAASFGLARWRQRRNEQQS
jgi:hypothetical protein